MHLLYCERRYFDRIHVSPFGLHFNLYDNVFVLNYCILLKYVTVCLGVGDRLSNASIKISSTKTR